MLDVSTMTVTIDGIEYIGGDLDLQGQELLRHVVDLRERKQELAFEMAQADVADHAFSEALRTHTQPKIQEAV